MKCWFVIENLVIERRSKKLLEVLDMDEESKRVKVKADKGIREARDNNNNRDARDNNNNDRDAKDNKEGQNYLNDKTKSNYVIILSNK